MPSRLLLQHGQPLQDPLGTEAGHHHCRLLHSFGTLVRLAEVQGGKAEDRGLLADGAAVRQHCPGLQLQGVVVEEAERLQQLYPRVER